MSQSQLELLVHIPGPHDEEQFIDAWVMAGPGPGRNRCVASVWGTPQMHYYPEAFGAKVLVTVHNGGTIAAFYHCDRVTDRDPLGERWEEEDAMDAAELAYTDR